MINYRHLGGLFDLEGLAADVAQYEHEMTQGYFWDDNDHAQAIIKKNNEAKAVIETFEDLVDDLESLEVAVALYEEEPDPTLFQEADTLTQQLDHKLADYRLQMLLSGKHDSKDAILELHPGAGGRESQDWGAMLLRMYQRWAHKHDYQVTVMDYQPDEDNGIKSATLEIAGHNAYGFLKSEKGIHRLIRISPFDTNNRRHTSFCSVEVTPLIDDSIEVEVNPEDLRIDTYRASGAGGQHINKTDSAVRITHLPTGIVTQSQAQRSQVQNKDQAMNMLRAKLYQLEEAKQAEAMAQLKGEQMDNAWGSQIRSYVFHPYSMVKDHRTNYEVGNAEAVIDGDLDDFIRAYLQSTIQEDN